MTRLYLAAILLLFFSSSANAISTGTEAREERKARQKAEIDRDIARTEEAKAQTENLQQMNAKLDKLYEQQAITNALLRQLIELQVKEVNLQPSEQQ